MTNNICYTLEERMRQELHELAEKEAEERNLLEKHPNSNMMKEQIQSRLRANSATRNSIVQYYSDVLDNHPLYHLACGLSLSCTVWLLFRMLHKYLTQ